MNTETMIKELNAVAEKHKNDFVPTFQTNISAMCRDIIPKLEQLAEYEAIGTVEECREAMERQRAKKPLQGEPFSWIDSVKVGRRWKEVRKTSYGHACPNCGKSIAKLNGEYCSKCGQAIDWSDAD